MLLLLVSCCRGYNVHGRVAGHRHGGGNSSVDRSFLVMMKNSAK
jgi:hypothetical protein